MFAIQLIHKNGGSKSIRASTISAVKDAAKKASNDCSDYVASTIPYAVYLSPGWTSTYDVSLPFEILQGLGIELRLLYKQEKE